MENRDAFTEADPYNDTVLHVRREFLITILFDSGITDRESVTDIEQRPAREIADIFVELEAAHEFAKRSWNTAWIKPHIMDDLAVVMDSVIAGVDGHAFIARNNWTAKRYRDRYLRLAGLFNEALPAYQADDPGMMPHIARNRAYRLQRKTP